MSTMLWARDLIWPFCGWRPGRMHDLYFGRVLTITAEAICRRCDRRWMVHQHQPGMLPWDDEIEAFFLSRRVGRGRDTPAAEGEGGG